MDGLFMEKEAIVLIWTGYGTFPSFLLQDNDVDKPAIAAYLLFYSNALFLPLLLEKASKHKTKNLERRKHCQKSVTYFFSPKQIQSITGKRWKGEDEMNQSDC